MTESQVSFVRCVAYIVLKLLTIGLLIELCEIMETKEFIDQEKISVFSYISLIMELCNVWNNKHNIFVILMRSLVTGLSTDIVEQQTRALYTLTKIFHLPLGFVINFATMSFYKLSIQYILMLTVSDYVDASATIPFLSVSQIDLIESETKLYWIMLYISANTIFEMCKDGIFGLLKKWYKN